MPVKTNKNFILNRCQATKIVKNYFKDIMYMLKRKKASKNIKFIDVKFDFAVSNVVLWLKIEGCYEKNLSTKPSSSEKVPWI